MYTKKKDKTDGTVLLWWNQDKTSANGKWKLYERAKIYFFEFDGYQYGLN